jgi:hypothetical protein
LTPVKAGSARAGHSQGTQAQEPAMPREIPMDCNPVIEVDGSVVARALGLEAEAFRELMARQRITQLCERGTGAEAGLYRASFYYGRRRARLVVDQAGRLQGEVESR